MHAAGEFVHDFHGDLSHWFAGSADRREVLSRLREATPDDMNLVYPSGERLSGRAFLESIDALYGTSPGFVAAISDLTVVRSGDDYAVVSYIETQSGARQSTSTNRRSALAVVEHHDGRWRWRFIQETRLD